MNRGRERRGGNRRRSDSGGGWLPFVVGFAIGAFLGIINCHLDPDWIGSDEVDSDGKRKRKAGLLSGALAGVFGAGASEDSSGGDGQRAKSKDGYGTDEDGNSKSIAMSQAVRDKLDQDGKSSEASRGENKGGKGSYGVSKTSGGAKIPCEDVNAAGAVNKSPENTTSSGGINKSSSSSGNRDDGISSNKESSGPAEDCMVIDATKVKEFSIEDKASSGKTSNQEASGNSQKTPIDVKKPCPPKAESKLATDGANSNTTATGGGGTSSKEQKPCPEKVTNTKEEGNDSFSSVQKPGTTKELPDGHPCKTKLEQKKEMENVKEPCPEKKN